MEGKVQVISRETIMPFSKTPIHNKTLQFSYVDQLVSEIYIPFIFFFEADESTGLTTSNHPKISLHLKHSLSRCLPSFYPLAGRVTNNHSALCNDAGVDFVEARAHARLTDVVHHRDVEVLKQYFPVDTSSAFGHDISTPLVLVQLTLFDCGGVSLGACISHKVADFASAMEFVRAWSAECRGVPEAPEFSFGTSRYFPPYFVLAHVKQSSFFALRPNLRFRRFVFDSEKLARLKRAAAASSDVSDPSKVELVSAFLWKQYIKAAKSRGLGASFAFHAVNLRRRISDLQNVWGNCSMFSTASARCDEEEDGGGFPRLIGVLRTAIRKVRDDYVMKPLSRGGVLVDLLTSAFQIVVRKSDRCTFTSWRGFDVYGVDYGWGKPVWFSAGPLRGNNVVILVDSRNGDGVEALVKADQDVLAEIESQMRFQ